MQRFSFTVLFTGQHEATYADPQDPGYAPTYVRQSNCFCLVHRLEGR